MTRKRYLEAVQRAGDSFLERAFVLENLQDAEREQLGVLETSSKADSTMLSSQVETSLFAEVVIQP